MHDEKIERWRQNFRYCIQFSDGVSKIRICVRHCCIIIQSVIHSVCCLTGTTYCIALHRIAWRSRLYCGTVWCAMQHQSVNESIGQCIKSNQRNKLPMTMTSTRHIDSSVMIDSTALISFQVPHSV